MANQIPLTGAIDAAGGYLLPPEQGEILTNGLLQETGGLQVCGDARATSSRKTQFGIFLGKPTAGFVAEGAQKPVTGAEFAQTTLNIKKVASIILLTDELREDIRNGDLNALVDSGVRSAISDVIDAHLIGKDDGTNVTTQFDSMLRSTTATTEYDGAQQDALRRAVSAAMGTLEDNGYGDQSQMAVLLSSTVRRAMRDARSAVDSSKVLYETTSDPLYGLQDAYSSNLSKWSDTAAATKILGFVVHKPNLHVRVRKDVTVSVTNEATVHDGTANRNLWQENLTGLRYETRIGFMVHDLNRAVVAIVDATA